MINYGLLHKHEDEWRRATSRVDANERDARCGKEKSRVAMQLVRGIGPAPENWLVVQPSSLNLRTKARPGSIPSTQVARLTRLNQESSICVCHVLCKEHVSPS